MTEATKLGETADREITATRLLDAPRELEWEVWTNPKHLAQWWGPNGFTNTIHEIDWFMIMSLVRNFMSQSHLLKRVTKPGSTCRCFSIRQPNAKTW